MRISASLTLVLSMPVLVCHYCCLVEGQILTKSRSLQHCSKAEAMHFVWWCVNEGGARIHGNVSRAARAIQLGS